MLMSWNKPIRDGITANQGQYVCFDSLGRGSVDKPFVKKQKIATKNSQMYEMGKKHKRF